MNIVLTLTKTNQKFKENQLKNEKKFFRNNISKKFTYNFHWKLFWFGAIFSIIIIIMLCVCDLQVTSGICTRWICFQLPKKRKRNQLINFE